MMSTRGNSTPRSSWRSRRFARRSNGRMQRRRSPTRERRGPWWRSSGSCPVVRSRCTRPVPAPPTTCCSCWRGRRQRAWRSSGFTASMRRRLPPPPAPSPGPLRQRAQRCRPARRRTLMALGSWCQAALDGTEDKAPVGATRRRWGLPGGAARRRGGPAGAQGTGHGCRGRSTLGLRGPRRGRAGDERRFLFGEARIGRIAHRIEATEAETF
mmetsp:Transcript_61561/g.178541  ORF Transcript_61561/g.178541 Transcript_61561/m.178541 type:complete len:212 (+) Transcript_61561:1847-2482(+)